MSKHPLTPEDEERELKKITWSDIDEEMDDIVLALNILPGVCTMQSCQGHRRGKHIDDAHLWIWLSDECMRIFEENVETLTDNHNVHRLYKQFVPIKDGGYIEVVDIRFAGLGKEEVNFIQSKKSILAYFTKISSIVRV